MLSETGTISAEAWDADGRHVRVIGPPTTTYRCQHGHIWTEEGRRQIRQKGGVDPTGVVVAGPPVVKNEQLLNALTRPLVPGRVVRRPVITEQLDRLVTGLRQGLNGLFKSLFGRSPVRNWQSGVPAATPPRDTTTTVDVRAIARNLVWVQASRRARTFELRSGEDVVGTLHVPRGFFADAEMAGNHWTFERQGFWHSRVTVRIAGSDAEVALFLARWTGGGSLELPRGRKLRFSSVNLLRSEWVWQESTEAPLVRFKGPHGLLRARAQVDISPNAVGDPDMPLLLLLGWYLILL